jgi:hypothetical protein
MFRGVTDEMEYASWQAGLNNIKTIMEEGSEKNSS